MRESVAREGGAASVEVEQAGSPEMPLLTPPLPRLPSPTSSQGLSIMATVVRHRSISCPHFFF